MRLVCFGDSLTWGQYGGSYVDALRERTSGAHEILNAGVGGNTIINLLNRHHEDVIEAEPDAVYVMIGGNDAISYSQPDTRPYYRKTQKIPNGFLTPDEFASAYRTLVNQLQVNHIETYIGLPPIEANPAVVSAAKVFNDQAREIARASNVPVLDLMAHFLPQDDALPERPSLSLKTIQLIGERGRTGWNDYAAEQKRSNYRFTFDGVHWTPQTATEAAHLISEFTGL